MKTKILLFIFGVIMSTFSSCKKENNSPDNADDIIPTGIKIKNFIPYPGDIFTLLYDNQGRCIKFSDAYNIDQYVYSANLLKKYHWDVGASEPYDSIIYILNNQGYAISDNEGFVYNYDSLWHLISKVKGSDSFSYSWVNGNKVSETSSFSGEVKAYTYFTNKDNTIGFENMGMYYLGKTSKNLISELVDSLPFNPTTTFTYTYEFDSQNRVTKSTELSSAGDPPGVISFVYY